MYKLENKVALVTGAGGKGGIGRAIALRLAREGADVAINDLPDSQANDVVAEVSAIGRNSLAVEADITCSVAVDNMVDQVVRHFGRIDILVNNAASRPGADRVPVVELTEDAWDIVQQVNLKGTFLCSRTVARQLIAQGTGGKILCMSSSRGKKGAARYAAYCASKFAVIGFAESLALELGPHGIQVNTICPGMVATDRIRDIAASLAPENQTEDEYWQNMLAERAASLPLGRVAEADDIARVAAFLVSPEADYLTGLSVPVAGGMLM